MIMSTVGCKVISISVEGEALEAPDGYFLFE